MSIELNFTIFLNKIDKYLHILSYIKCIKHKIVYLLNIRANAVFAVCTFINYSAYMAI